MQEFLMNDKNILWLISVIITVVGYYIYIKDIFYWQNRPHFYSWFVCSLTTIIIYFIQIWNNSWAWTWAVLFTALIWFLIAGISVFRWTKDITKSDTVSLILAFFAIWLWLINENPLYALILLVAIDIFWYYPTFRKSIVNPFEENYVMYALSIFKFWIAVLALNQITLESSLYLISNFIILFFLVALIFFGRKLFVHDDIKKKKIK
jgi:hypothetical protein